MSNQQFDPNEGGPWDVGMERVPLVKLENNEVHIENFRNFRYECDGSHQENYESRTVKVDDLESAEFIVVPFSSQPDLAHTMMSFGTRDGHLGRFISPIIMLQCPNQSNKVVSAR